LWDVLKGDTVCKFYGHYGDINSVSFSAEEQVVISGGYDGSVKFWDLKQKLNKYRMDLSSSNKDPQSSGNDKNNYSGLIADYNNYSDTITCLIVQDCNVYAGCLDGSVMNIDLRQGLVTKDKIYPSEGKEKVKSGVIRMDMLKDNKTMLVSLQNGEIKLYNTIQGNVINSYTGHSLP
jgi:WD40 repeat protein